MDLPPLRLALVETKAMLSELHNAAAWGCEVSRTASVLCTRRNQCGQLGSAGIR